MTKELEVGMPLYDVPNGSKIRVLGDITVPVGSPGIKKDEILKFSRIDGMYSSCINEQGDTVHLVAWAQVEIIK